MKIPRHPKLRGESAEVHFLARSEHGLGVAKPYGDCRPYDFIVESNGRMFRVQVKSTSNKSPDSDGYKCQVRPPRRPRDRFEVLEFLAVYVIPEDVWYIIPYSEFADKRAINLNPRSQRSPYRQYRDAWDLLVAESPSDVRRRRKREQLVKARGNGANRRKRSTGAWVELAHAASD